MLNLLRRLNRARFQPIVAQLRPGLLSERLKELQVEVRHLRPHRLRQVWRVWQVVKQLSALIHDESIDVVHSNGFRAHLYGGLAARMRKVPSLWSTFTVERLNWFTKAVLAIPASRVLAICPRTADFFVARGQATTLLWPGVDAAQLGDHTPRQELAARYAIPSQQRWIVQAARLQRYKGQEYFLRGLAALPVAQNEACAVIVGGTLFNQETEYLEALKRLARGLGVERRVHFTGFVGDRDLRGFLAGSELVVHPALDEDFGLAVAEAQALGRPVLAFASHGPAIIVRDGLTGRLVPVGDQRQFDAALADLLSHPERLSAWGKAAVGSVLSRFEAEGLARQLERLYEACLGAGV